jgi:hypothetical protein
MVDHEEASWRNDNAPNLLLQTLHSWTREVEWMRQWAFKAEKGVLFGGGSMSFGRLNQWANQLSTRGHSHIFVRQ